MPEYKRDWVYIALYALQIIPLVLMDAPSLPGAHRITSHVPWLASFHASHVSSDKMLSSMHKPTMGWFVSFVLWELCFSFPIFLLGIRALLSAQASRSGAWAYPFLLAQAAHQSTTVSACLVHFYRSGDEELERLVWMYGPFLVVPLVAMVDFGSRLVKIVRRYEAMLSEKKDR